MFSYSVTGKHFFEAYASAVSSHARALELVSLCCGNIIMITKSIYILPSRREHSSWPHILNSLTNL
jgi:hypothetical protein